MGIQHKLPSIRTMKNIKHVHYPNPTIIEAVIEIRLDKPLIHKDNEKIETTFGAKYSLEKDEIIIYTASINPGGMSLHHDKPGQMRLKLTIGEQIFVQVYPDRFSFHWVGKYPGWNKFLDKSEHFWKQLCKALPKITFRQIGIRFINKLCEKTVDQKLGYWLKASPNYPKNILSVQTDYFYKCKWPLNSDRFAQICIAEAEITENQKPLIFDIDVILQVNKPLKIESALTEIAQDLHNDVYNIFESSVSSNYKKVLNLQNRII